MSTKFKVGDRVFVSNIRPEDSDDDLTYFIGKSGKIIEICWELQLPYKVKFRKLTQDFFEDELVPYGKNVKVLFGK